MSVRRAKIKPEPFEQNGAKISRYRSELSAPSRRSPRVAGLPCNPSGSGAMARLRCAPARGSLTKI